MLNQRITIFVNLPPHTLDHMALEQRLSAIGKTRIRHRVGCMSGPVSLARRLAAEGLGTAFLLATVIGSGIMGERLAGGNDALALLGNTLPTGAILVVLILIFGPFSGAHFNPAVSIAFAARGEWRAPTALPISPRRWPAR